MTATRIRRIGRSSLILALGFSTFLSLGPFRFADAATRRGVVSVHFFAGLRYRGPTEGPSALRIRPTVTGEVVFRDAHRVLAGSGCRALSRRAAVCPGSRVRMITGSFGDYVAVKGDVSIDAHTRAGQDFVRGGAAADTIYAGFGPDTVVGHQGGDELGGNANNDRLYGGPGNDTLLGGPGADGVHGGPGDDMILQSGGAPAGGDELSGGAGTDTIDFGFLGSANGVTVSLDGLPNDGPPGGDDNVGPGIERILGTREKDSLTGNERANVLIGDDGADTIVGGAGRDVLVGGHGDDSIDARDGFRDRVVCGTGPADVADVDPQDSVTPSCETVNVAP